MITVQRNLVPFRVPSPEPLAPSAADIGRRLITKERDPPRRHGPHLPPLVGLRLLLRGVRNKVYSVFALLTPVPRTTGGSLHLFTGSELWAWRLLDRRHGRAGLFDIAASGSELAATSCGNWGLPATPYLIAGTEGRWYQDPRCCRLLPRWLTRRWRKLHVGRR